MQRGVRLFEYDAALASIASCKDRLEENLTQFQRDMNTRRTFSLDPATTTSTFHHGDAPLAYLYEWGLDSNDEFVTFYDSDDAFFERDYGEDEDDDFQDGLDPAGEDFGILVPKIYHAGESHRRKQARRNRDAGEELSDWEVNYLEEDDSAKQTLRDIVKRVESNVLVTAPEKLRYDKYRRKMERNRTPLVLISSSVNQPFNKAPLIACSLMHPRGLGDEIPKNNRKTTILVRGAVLATCNHANSVSTRCRGLCRAHVVRQREEWPFGNGEF